MTVVCGCPRPFDVFPDDGVREEPPGDVGAVPNKEDAGLVSDDGPDEGRVSGPCIIDVEPLLEERLCHVPLSCRDSGLDEFFDSDRVLRNVDSFANERMRDIHLFCDKGKLDEFPDSDATGDLWQDLFQEEVFSV